MHPVDSILSQPFIRIVILAFDGVDMTMDCIRSVLESSWPQEHQQVILVDNGSLDDVVARTAESFPEVKIIEPLENLGFAAGCNLGITSMSASNGAPLQPYDFVALVNNDATVSKSWLEPLANELKSFDDVGAAAPKILFAPQFLEVEISRLIPDSPKDYDEQVSIFGARINGERNDGLLIFDEGFSGPCPFVKENGDEFARWTKNGGRVRLSVCNLPEQKVHRITLRIGARVAGRVRIRSGTNEFSIRVGAGQDVEPFGSRWIEFDINDDPFDVVNNVGSELYEGGSAGDRGFLERDRGQYDQPREVFAWCGGAVLLRKAYLDQVGLFDESFFLYYEDTDLSWRGQLLGWSYRYVPTSVVRHKHAQSSGVGSELFRFQVERNRLLVLTKNAPLKIAAKAVIGEVKRFLGTFVKRILYPVMSLRRPHLTEFRFKYRVMRSYLELLPKTLNQRWMMGRCVSRRKVMMWAVQKVVPYPVFADVALSGLVLGRDGSSSLGERPRAAVYNLYWSTLGGGEVVSGEFARALASTFDVTLLGPERPDFELFQQRLGTDLSGCEWRKVASDEEASIASRDFDVFVNCTYLSSAVNVAPIGLYYVHFPGMVKRKVPKELLRAGVLLSGFLARMPVVSRKFQRVRNELQDQLVDTQWTNSYSTFFANSAYTQSWIQSLWKQSSDVVYPPVATSVGPGEKETLIASVGRFFDPKSGHSKKQLELVTTFKAMIGSDQKMDSWRLALVGGAERPHRDYVLRIRRLAQQTPVEIHVNASRSKLETVLSQASIYWHAGGFGEDQNRHPERFEHFGISIVEAMAAGAVPVVYGVAGPAEIVRHGVDGFHWTTLAELISFTQQLVTDPELRRSMSERAQSRAEEYTSERFVSRVQQILQECAVSNVR